MSSPAARSAARQARYKRRQRAGEIVLTLALPEHAVALALIKTHQLTPEAALDRDRVRDALQVMLVDWADAWAEHPR